MLTLGHQLLSKWTLRILPLTKKRCLNNKVEPTEIKTDDDIQKLYDISKNQMKPTDSGYVPVPMADFLIPLNDIPYAYDDNMEEDMDSKMDKIG